MSYRIIIVVLSSLIPAVVAVLAMQAPTATVFSPYPVIGWLLRALVGTKGLAVATSLTFLVLYYHLAVSTSQRIPRKIPIIMAVVTAISILHFAMFSRIGVVYQGAAHVTGVAIANAFCCGVLWGAWRRWRTRGGFSRSVVLAVLVHSWLFGLALPILGELP